MVDISSDLGQPEKLFRILFMQAGVVQLKFLMYLE